MILLASKFHLLLRSMRSNILLYFRLNSGHKTAQDLRKSFNAPFNQQALNNSLQYHPMSSANLIEPGSVPAFNSNINNSMSRQAIITKKDMLRERSLNAAAGKKAKLNLKADLNPYSYVPRSKQ